MSSGNPILDAIAGAKTFGSGGYIKSGDYTFEVLDVMCEKKESGFCFIAEFVVRDASPTEQGIIMNKVGTSVSIVYNLTKNEKTANANSKKFVCGLLGENPDEVDVDEFAKTLALIVGKGRPARGMLIKCSASTKATRNSKNPTYTDTRWTTVSGEDENAPDKVKARRAELDKSTKAK